MNKMIRSDNFLSIGDQKVTCLPDFLSESITEKGNIIEKLKNYQ